MFETVVEHRSAPANHTWQTPRVTAEPRSSEQVSGDCLLHMLDEIDYGMVLVNKQAHVHYMNHAARLELDGDHALQLQGNTLRTRNMRDLAGLHEALAGAQRGMRKMLMLGSDDRRVGVSVVPLSGNPAAPEGLALLVLGKRQTCAELTVLGFARAMALTHAETQVLQLLCEGRHAADIAEQLDVGLCTVRTHIGHIRGKTDAASITALLRQVVTMPPLLRALRTGAAGAAL